MTLPRSFVHSWFEQERGYEPRRFDIATAYGLDDQGVGVRVPVGSRVSPSPSRTDRLWGPPNLLFNEYGGFFLWVKAEGVPSSRNCGSICPLPPYAFMTTLPYLIDVDKCGQYSVYIVTYMGVTIRRGLDWLIGFIALVHSARNYK
jgi:hypothetical protein